MTAPDPHLATARPSAQEAGEIAVRFFTELGAWSLDLLATLNLMLGQGQQEISQTQTTGGGEIMAPAILMAGGLATLAVLFAIMVVRKNPVDEAQASPRPMSPGAASGAGSPPVAEQEAARDMIPVAEVEPVSPTERTSEEDDLALTLATGSNLGREPSGESRALALRHPKHRELLERGRQAGGRFQGQDMHELLQHITETGLGEPRVLQQVPHLVRIRLVHCRGCSSSHSPRRDGQARCPFEEGFLEAAFGRLQGDNVVVRETACRHRGDPGCDFEVWF